MLKEHQKKALYLRCTLENWSTLKNWFALIELWMHLGSLRSTKEEKELLEAIAESNSSFLSALQTSQVHP